MNRNTNRSLNGDRTRISALRGPRPKPLDDKAGTINNTRLTIVNRLSTSADRLLPRKDSNLDKQIQSLLSCH
jgi:hypothetical protein